ncbi:flagellar basal body rod protein FlgC [Proteinivorax hydrogeniformans]|uniref:Flagellar basal-body rod protein FlgC n=1 Tax=Proteinivorax hydrogeniformans TaxID=1826727 RepID=A0AAU8HPQ2_9FIRM
MSIFNTINTSASGLTAQRLRLDVISENIANVNTTRTEDGGPYRRKEAVLASKEEDSFQSFLRSSINAEKKHQPGVKVSRIVEDQSPFVQKYQPDHPDADENGIVQKPNVNIVTEMTNMISANRSYEANVTSINTAKSMAMKSLEIGR